MGRLLVGLLFLLSLSAEQVYSDDPDSIGTPAVRVKKPDRTPFPVVRPIVPGEKEKVNWERLGEGSLRFLTVMQAFRYATEAGTRSGGIGVGSGYINSAGNLHGWDDGDPFYVNYIGHPMQGAVSGNLFATNDPRYNRFEFGSSSGYWKGNFERPLLPGRSASSLKSASSAKRR